MFKLAQIESITANWLNESLEVGKLLKEVEQDQLFAVDDFKSFDEWIKARFGSAESKQLSKAQHNLVLALIEMKKAYDEHYGLTVY